MVRKGFKTLLDTNWRLFESYGMQGYLIAHINGSPSSGMGVRFIYWGHIKIISHICEAFWKLWKRWIATYNEHITIGNWIVYIQIQSYYVLMLYLEYGPFLTNYILSIVSMWQTDMYHLLLVI